MTEHNEGNDKPAARRRGPILDAQTQQSIVADYAKVFEEAAKDAQASPEDKKDFDVGMAQVRRQQPDRFTPHADDAQSGTAAPSKPEGKEGGDAGEPRARDERGRFLADGKEGPASEVLRAAKETAAEDAPLILNYRGREVRVPKEEAVALAQQGLDYSKKMEGLKKDTQEWKDFQAYRQYLEKNPNLAVAMGTIMDSFQNTGQVPRLVLDRGDVQAGEVEVTPDLAQLRAQQARQQAWIEQQEASRTVDARIKAMEEAIERTPVLRALSARSLAHKWPGGKPRDLALEKLVSLAQSDPDADVLMLARIAATDVAEVAETLAVDPSYVARKEQDRERFRSESPAGASQPPAKERQLTREDLRNGNVAKSAIDFLRKSYGIHTA